MENFEAPNYRQDLAREISETPKEERPEILREAQESPEYWQARNEKISGRQNEEEIDDGLGIFVKNKTIYHGSGTSGIEKFTEAEEITVGSGIYFTSSAEDAIGYARIRAKSQEDKSPVVYESVIENMKLMDLRKDENVKKVLGGFKDVLANELKDPDLKWPLREIRERAIQAINSERIRAGNIKYATQSLGKTFSNYVKTYGYDGLATIEGGEGDIGNHDTFVIFDPEKVTINKEQEVI